jgi:NADH dehydrogenase
VGALPGNVKLFGTVAWLIYIGVHLVYLAGFRNRISAFASWAWSYLTYSRGARLIPTGEGAETPPTTGKAAHLLEQRPAAH